MKFYNLRVKTFYLVACFCLNLVISNNTYAVSCKSLLSAPITNLSMELLVEEVNNATGHLSTRQKADIILKAARGEAIADYFSPQAVAALKNRMNAESIGDQLKTRGVLLYDFSLLKSVSGQAQWNSNFKVFQDFARQLGVTIENFTAAELSGFDLSKQDALSLVLNPAKRFLQRLPEDYLMRGKIDEILRRAETQYQRDVVANEAVAGIPLVQNILELTEEQYLSILDSENPLRIYEMSSSVLGWLDDTDIQHWFAFFVIEALVRAEVDHLKSNESLNWPRSNSSRLYDQRILFLSQFPQFLPYLNSIDKIIPTQIRVWRPDFESPYEYSKVKGLDGYWTSPLLARDYDTDILSDLTFGFSLTALDIESYFDSVSMTPSQKKIAQNYLAEHFLIFLKDRNIDASKLKLNIEDGYGEVIVSVQGQDSSNTWIDSIEMTLEFFNEISSSERYNDEGLLLIQ